MCPVRGRTYSGAHLDRIAFPMGGIGAGMLCLEGSGALSHVSVRHRPEVNNEPGILAALHVKGVGARVVEGPVPRWKTLGMHAADRWQESGNGLRGRTYGLPRFARASFRAQFPFATVDLSHPSMPVRVTLTGWSPFLPGNADDSSLTVDVLLAWHVPFSNLREGKDPGPASSCGCGAGSESCYRPWYASRFAGVGDVAAYWRGACRRLRRGSLRFSDCFHDTSLPSEMLESAAATLSILKSPTVLRQADGRLWGWEGCHENAGCCMGSCTHVWNYAQALPHLFPSLERTLRETEFGVSQDERGHQNFRASLPIRPAVHDFHAAADGQLGGLVKLHREWRISGDTEWMRRLWPAAKRSLDYAIATWDPDHTGTVSLPC